MSSVTLYVTESKGLSERSDPMQKSLGGRRAATIFFSLLMALVLGFFGLLVGSLLWDRFGSPRGDETTSESVGILAMWAFAIMGGSGCLWKFWPRDEGGKKQH
jgi:hypothetical protein